MQTDGGSSASRREVPQSEVLMLLSFHEQGGKKRDLEARLEHLAAELADVFNVAEQVIALFGLETDFRFAPRGRAENLEADSGGGAGE